MLENATLIFRTMVALLALGAGGVVGAAYESEPDPIELLSFSSHSRLSFHIDDGIKTEWKGNESGFELRFKNTTLADFGVPPNQEEAMASKLKRLADHRVGEIQVVVSDRDLILKGKWKFPTGQERLLQEKMESFLYRQRSPSRVFVDFWYKPSPLYWVAKKQAQQEARDRELKNAKDQQEKMRVAQAKAEVERADYTNFEKLCEGPLTPESQVFLEFRPVHQRVDFAKWIPVNDPASKFPWKKPKGKSEEEELVRKALELYEGGKPALAIRAVEFFDEKFHHSSFKTQMRLLKSSCHTQLLDEASAARELEAIVLQDGTSPEAFYAMTTLAARAHAAEDFLGSLEKFLWLAKRYPKHPNAWLFHLGAAEALYGLKETERASREYELVVKMAPTQAQQAEAASRMGDSYMNRRLYAQALASYYRAMKAYPKEVKGFASVELNRAESLYWLGERDRAKAEFEKFLKDRPYHPWSWRASFRLGEILARSDLATERAKGREYFYHTINHHPFSPGTVLARLRLLPCGDHGGFDGSSAERFLREDAEKYTGGGDVILDQYRDLLSLTEVRAFMAFGQHEDVMPVIARDVSGTLKESTKELLRKALLGSLRASTLERLSAKEPYEALTLYRSYESLLPAKAEVSVLDFMLKLSAAAAEMNLPSLADQIIAQYRKMSGSESRNPAATRGALALHPQSAAEAFTVAKNIWLQKGLDAEENVRLYLQKVPENSAENLDAQILLAAIESKKKNPGRALLHVSKAQILLGAEVGPRFTHLKYWLAQIHFELKKNQEAARLYRELSSSVLVPKTPAPSASPLAKEAAPSASAPVVVGHSLWTEWGAPALPSAAGLAIEEAAVFERMNQYGEVRKTFSRAVEAGVESNRILYSYAIASEKDAMSPEEVRTLLGRAAQGKENDFWKTLARQALANRTKEGQ